MTGKISSYSKIFNNTNCLELIQDYNDTTVMLEMLNVEKKLNVKELTAKKVKEAIYKAKKLQPRI